LIHPWATIRHVVPIAYFAWLILIVPALALDDGGLCQMLSELADDANERLGSPIDGLSSNEGVDLSCESKTIVFHKSIALSSSELTWRWQLAMQQDLNSIYCTGEMWEEVMAKGWTVAVVWAAFDGKQVTFEPQCRHRPR
jgi:hypothetical protein